MGAEKVSGCANTTFDPERAQEIQFKLSLDFDGRKASGSFVSGDGKSRLEMPVEASVTSDSKGGQAQSSGASSISETGQAKDVSDKDLNEGLAQVGLMGLREGVSLQDLVDKMRPRTGRDTRINPPYYARKVIDSFMEETGNFPQFSTYHDKRAGLALGSAAFMAAMETDGRRPLFPSVREAMPLIARMSVKATASDRDLRAVERLLVLLGTMDMAKTELGGDK